MNKRTFIQTKSSRARRSGKFRLGTAVLETAIALPLLTYLSMGMVDFGQFFYIKHAFEAAARDGVRAGILASATQTQVNNIISTTLLQANVTYNSSWLTMSYSQDGVNYYSVTDVSTVPAGDMLTFNLTTAYNNIPNAVRPLYSITGKGIGNGKPVTGYATMIKE